MNEFSIQALPLRERKEDILIFANHFLDKANEELGKQVAGFDEEVMRIFRTCSRPGNLREMRNIVKRATLLCMGSLISKTCLPPELEQKPVEPEKTSTTRREMEIELIKDAMQKCRNNKSEAARMLRKRQTFAEGYLKSFGLGGLVRYFERLLTCFFFQLIPEHCFLLAGSFQYSLLFCFPLYPMAFFPGKATRE